MTYEALIKLAKGGALVTIFTGVAGSLMCMPFAYSSNLWIIATVGIYFVAGAVMITGGLIAFAVLMNKERA